MVEKLNWKTIALCVVTALVTTIVANWSGNTAKMPTLTETIEAKYDAETESFNFSDDPTVAYVWEEHEVGDRVIYTLVNKMTGESATYEKGKLAKQHEKWIERREKFPQAPQPNYWNITFKWDKHQKMPEEIKVKEITATKEVMTEKPNLTTIPDE